MKCKDIIIYHIKNVIIIKSSLTKCVQKVQINRTLLFEEKETSEGKKHLKDGSEC